MGRPERGKRKLAFSLSVKDKEMNGSGEGTMSLEQGMGSFLEEVKLELGLPVVRLSIWEFFGSNGLTLLSGFPKSRARVNGF